MTSGLVSSIVRFVTFSNNNSFIDATWNAVDLIIWTIAEPGIYLVAACLMTYRPLLDKLSTKVKLQTRRGHPDARSSAGTMPTSRPAVTLSKTASRLPPHLSSDGFMLNSDRGILLSSIKARGDGFEHLSDYEEHPGEMYTNSAQTSDDGIVKTVNIRQSWEHVR